MRRSNERNPCSRARKAPERRQKQAQLADALVVDQKLGQRALGPAASRQLPVELGKAAGDGMLYARLAVAAPDERVVQQFSDGGLHRRTQAHPAASRAGFGKTGRDSLSNDRSMRQAVKPSPMFAQVT